MKPIEALNVVEQARMVISLNGKEADVLREAVITLNNFIVEVEQEREANKEKLAKQIPINNGKPE